MGKGRPVIFSSNLVHRPIFNQKSNWKGFRSEKRPLGGHIGGQKSIWSKIDNRRKVPHWKAYDSGNSPIKT